MFSQRALARNVYIHQFESFQLKLRSPRPLNLITGLHSTQAASSQEQLKCGYLATVYAWILLVQWSISILFVVRRQSHSAIRATLDLILIYIHHCIIHHFRVVANWILLKVNISSPNSFNVSFSITNVYFCLNIFKTQYLPPVRFELTTPGLRDQCSKPLSYRGTY